MAPSTKVHVAKTKEAVSDTTTSFFDVTLLSSGQNRQHQQTQRDIVPNRAQQTYSGTPPDRDVIKRPQDGSLDMAYILSITH